MDVLTRRSLVALPLLLTTGMVAPIIAADDTIALIERRHGGQLGVFAIDTGSGQSLAHHADKRFLLCSTVKGLLAGHVLSRVDAGQESLDRAVPYGPNDLKPTSPVTKAHVGQGALPVGALCEAMVETSDNTAAVLLMRSVGGPAGLTRFIRSLGDTVTRSDRYELESNDRSSMLDTTTPRAIAGSVRTLLLGNALSANSRALLEQWMVASKPGLTRLRAAFPSDWSVGDKTGTGPSGETNDYAIVRPPGRAPLIVAAYYEAPRLGFDMREAVLREVGAAFVQWLA